MKQLERLQILCEIIREFKTAILMDQAPEQTGQLVLEVIQETNDKELTDHVINAYLKLTNPQVAVFYLDKATQHLYNHIDEYTGR